MVYIYDVANRVIRRSRNLRAITTHLRECDCPPSQVSIRRAAGGGAVLSVTWMNGDTVSTGFVDWTVCCDWVSKRRALHGTPFYYGPDRLGVVSATHPWDLP